MTDLQRTWGSAVELCANSGIQFLDFTFTGNDVRGFSADFAEEVSSAGIQRLYKYTEDQNPEIAYQFSVRDVMQRWENQWVPIPCYANSGENMNEGPFNWTRAHLTTSKKEGSIENYSLQIAVDTTINASENSLGYQQPNKEDTDVAREFSFRSDFETVSNFLKEGCDNPGTFDFQSDEAWVSEWAKANFNRFPEDTKLHPDSELEAWASYIAFVEFVNKTLAIKNIKLRPSSYSQDDITKIDVDLVLDIGNSRTCGLLVEIPQGDGQNNLNMETVSQLCLRDLSKPDEEYSGLFESRVEFSDLSFGSDSFSRMSGRNNAFVWPSFVRFGPEAVRLMSHDTGNEAFSGLSSPKRYLWDNTLFEQRWRFHNTQDERRLPRSLRAMLPELTTRGESKDQIIRERNLNLRRPDNNQLQEADDAEFSKSSLYGFMIIEIIAQAFRQINDPSYRGNKANKTIPRALRNIIITLPTATPKQEQAIVKSKVQGALGLLWSRMANTGQVNFNTGPNINVDWDEASCSQVMFLYSEIKEKYQGDITNYLEVFGKKRIRSSDPNTPGSPEENLNSLRIACVDIGGGTTDLMISTFYQEHGVQLSPIQEFREGFRKAGDDLLCMIIERQIIPKIKEILKQFADEATISTILMQCLAKNVANRNAAERHQQRQFTIKVLAPLALEILRLDFSSSKIQTVRYKDLSDIEAANSVKIYIDAPIQNAINPDWSIEDLSISISEEDIKRIIEHSFKFVFENISEIILNSDVDRVLLTGRPSQNNLILDLLKNCCPLPPNRILSMSKYHTGAWYPFKSAQNTVGDPKSSVAVGAMVLSVAGSQRLPNFYIPTDQFKINPIDNYIGKYQNIGKISDDDLYFTPDQDEIEIKMMTDTFIGSRQVDTERWTATPLYKLYFLKVDGVLPLTVSLRKDGLNADALFEPITIVEAIDKNGKNQKRNIDIKLQTLGANEEYWLDSGAFDII